MKRGPVAYKNSFCLKERNEIACGMPRMAYGGNPFFERIKHRGGSRPSPFVPIFSLWNGEPPNGPYDAPKRFRPSPKPPEIPADRQNGCNPTSAYAMNHRPGRWLHYSVAKMFQKTSSFVGKPGTSVFWHCHP